MINIDELFNTVRTSLDNYSDTDAIWKEKLRFEAGKEYVVRLVPFVKNGPGEYNKSLFHYIRYTWKDADNKWVQVISPRTWGERCPISDYSRKIKFNGTKEEQDELNKRLSYREGAYANVYVINDPTNPENNGKVKILDMGKKLFDIIKGALDGNLDKSWTEQARTYSNDSSIEVNVGKKVYDLSKNGVNLIIRVKKNQFKLNSYDSSTFSLSNVDLGKTDAEINEIYQSCFDLSTIDKHYTFDELAKLFKESYFIDNEPVQPQTKVTTNHTYPYGINDNINNLVSDEKESIDDTETMIDEEWLKRFGSADGE